MRHPARLAAVTPAGGIAIVTGMHDVVVPRGTPVRDLPGFGAGTWLYRKSYELGSWLDNVSEKLLGIRDTRIRRRQEQLVNRVGDLRLAARDRALISTDQIAEVAELLEPGDLLLTRKEWYVSNLAMPGFWKHAVIYVGTPRERRRWLWGRDVRAWVRAQGIASGNFEDLLRQRNEAAWQQNRRQGDELSRRLVESNGDGVCLTPLESVATADSLAVLRPRLDKVARAQAIANAFSFVGRPYDYLFDFSCDESMICSEVVYKAYHDRPGQPGLKLELREISGRMAMPTNDLVKFYARRRNSANQDLELIAFLDGDEKTGRAEHASELDFARSWKRPVWRPFTGEGRANPPLLTGEHGCAAGQHQ